MMTTASPRTLKRSAVLTLFLAVLSSAPAFALTVAPIFGSRMVLQRGVEVPVFGTAAPGETVTVLFQAQQISAVAAPDGRWQVKLPPMPATTYAVTLTVVASNASITFAGVQVGEVWLCSGQSNMGRPLSSASGGAAANADAANHNLALFRMTGGNGPATTTWQIADSTTAAGFSAVCYWMGLELSYAFPGVAIGLVQATHDGTSISQWTHRNGGTGADYDAMIRPIQPFAITGVAWYQGESDAGDNTYDLKLAGMIGEWREDWELPLLPFGIVQLTWRPSGWTPAREAQLRATQNVPATFLVVTTDLPVSNYLHPDEKKPVGRRLAIGARGAVYGEAIDYSGPIRDLAGSFVSGSTVVIDVSHPGNGLFTSNGKAPGPFKIAGSNGRFQNATATIVGDRLYVTSSVSAPRILRYQWDYGVGNLFNRVSIPVEGGRVLIDRLPASQFEIRFP